jgi:hypothetical protein
VSASIRFANLLAAALSFVDNASLAMTQIPLISLTESMA